MAKKIKDKDKDKNKDEARPVVRIPRYPGDPYPEEEGSGSDSCLCYCGHELREHVYCEPASTFVPGEPEVEMRFTGCAGCASATHKGEKQICGCPVFQEFPFGLYRHLKTGNVYAVDGLAFNHEDRSIEVEYVGVDTGERWHRPLYSPKGAEKREGFFDPDEETMRPRFERVTKPVDLVRRPA